MNRFRLDTRNAVFVYACCLALILGLLDYLYARAYFPPVQPTSAGTNGLINRMAWYKAHAGEYNLVFIGDSRTYCGIHPELLDPLLGTSSINLASFSNWFMTQLPLIQDLAPVVPRGTTVVWTVGSQNFTPISSGVQRVYPVGIANAFRYLIWGLPSTGLADNVFYYNEALYFLAMRGEVRQDYVAFLDRPMRLDASSMAGALIPTARAQTGEKTAGLPSPPSDGDVEKMREHWARDPRVSYVDVLRDHGKATSLTIYFRRGSYYRIELDPAFFRKKQREFGSSYPAGAVPRADPGYWRVFDEILRTFKRHGIKLVVNEIEEAPFVYGSLQTRNAYRKFMRDVVEPEVKKYGFPYTRVNFDKLVNDDYFDYNHLNSRGAQVFIPMLAKQFRPYVRPASLSSGSGVR